MEHAKIIGANIKSLRELNGVKQELLAKKLGVSKGRMSQIEHGDCHELSLKKLSIIAEYIGVPFYDLFIPPPKKKQHSQFRLRYQQYISC